MQIVFESPMVIQFVSDSLASPLLKEIKGNLFTEQSLSLLFFMLQIRPTLTKML